MISPTDYSALVTSEHRDKPFFMAVVELMMSGPCDLQNCLIDMTSLFDLDGAVANQLDELGTWVGFGRYQFVPSLGNITLGDNDYRTLLRAKILGNHWDGGMQTLQTILASIFPGSGTTLFAVDRQDMSIDIYVTGTALTPTELALLQGGLLVPKPEGVRINGFIYITGPLFGLDFDNSSISGPDVGAFAAYL